MVWFFRDFLDGWLYLFVSFLSLVFIMAILGFMMERKKLETEEKAKMVILNNRDNNKINSVNNMNTVHSSDQSNDLVQENSEVTPKSVIPDEVLKKSINEGTNSKIPEILDLNSVDNNLENK